MKKEEASFGYSLGLSALLEEDLSSYEYYYSLPEDIRAKLADEDISTFKEMQDYVEKKKY